jgi:uncharacterized protein with HEPN domain
MLDLARTALSLAEGKSRADFDADLALRLSLAHLIQTIGEAAGRISHARKGRHPQVPWGKITGIRHRIVHDYLNVDYDIVWDVIMLDLSPLIGAREDLLTEEEGGQRGMMSLQPP